MAAFRSPPDLYGTACQGEVLPGRWHGFTTGGSLRADGAVVGGIRGGGGWGGWGVPGSGGGRAAPGVARRAGSAGIGWPPHWYSRVGNAGGLHAGRAAWPPAPG